MQNKRLFDELVLSLNVGEKIPDELVNLIETGYEQGDFVAFVKNNNFYDDIYEEYHVMEAEDFEYYKHGLLACEFIFLINKQTKDIMEIVRPEKAIELLRFLQQEV